MERGPYNEIVLRTLELDELAAVRQLVKDAAASSKVDEHGNWNFGIDTDREGRGWALNWDLYGVGRDVHTGGLLIVIQIRQCHIAKWGNNVRKNYFLIGYNEDGTAFAHSVPSGAVHAAIRAGKDVPLSVQTWMFGVDYIRVIRQGDLALIPLKRAPSAPSVAGEMLIEESHQLVATEVRANGHIYARDPKLVHLPGVHPEVNAEGWYRVQVAQRAPHWRFAARTVD